MDLQTALEITRTIIELASLLVAIVKLVDDLKRVQPPAGSQFLYMQSTIMCTLSFEHMI
jgi:hypothetical protein